MKLKRYLMITVIFIVFSSLALTYAQNEITNPLMRFPDIHGDWVTFVSGEDIWKAPASGGVAVRLTFHDGEERYPKFSPDGTLIAFSGEYDGNTDVYVMDLYGGNITRLTYHPGDDEVVGWHPIENKIIFRSSRLSYSRFDRLFTVSPEGNNIEPIVLHEVGQGAISPDGKWIAYNRIEREGRTWKRYQGGMAQDLYLYNTETKEDRQLTTYRGTDRLPMWYGPDIFFSSDRDRVLNLYKYDLESGAVTALTKHRDYDVRRPSIGGDKIIYELGPDLFVYDITNGQSSRLNIEVRNDAPAVRPYFKDVSNDLTQVALAPHGKRALLVARGEVFSVPRKEGVTFNLTQTSGAREKDAVWSPDGRHIAYFSDQDGEYNLYVRTPGIKGPAEKLTAFKEGYRHALRWSPDSKKIAFTDQTLTLFIIDIKTKKITAVDKAHYENVDVSLNLKPIYDFNWSPDSRFIAYSKMDSTWVNKLYIYALETAKVHPVSQGSFNDFHPVFAPDGEHLFFISNRQFEPTFGDFEWEMVYKNMAGIYAITLRNNGPALFPVAENDSEIKTGQAEALRIDFTGIAGRVEALPLKRGNYRFLSMNENTLFYLNKEQGDFNRFEFRENGPSDLFAFSVAGGNETLVIKSVDDYRLSADGTSIIYKQGSKAGIIDATARETSGNTLASSGLTMHFVPLDEWQQIFNETWRMERDYYYEPNMHGMDWPAMKEKYGTLIRRASCRQDVRYIVGELIGELNTSHTYVYGGDKKETAPKVNVGLLGADYKKDVTANRYRFSKIYREVNWNAPEGTPLHKSIAPVEAGEYLIAVNGNTVDAGKNIYSYFTGLAGQAVELTVSASADGAESRTYTVKPVSSERYLRYFDWVEHNRRFVEKESGGKLGYIHLPDTYTGSARVFPRYYYSQTGKKGIVVDGRYNAGGLDPDIFLQRLDKKPLSYWTRRNSHDFYSPWLGNRAHLVCLTNRQAGSGGDELPHLFRERGMGPVIGTRTWGGLVGVSMFISLVDGGAFTVPDYRIYDPQGNWVVENEGVTPDIIIDNTPAEVARGYDAQLMKGIEILMDKIEQEPRPWPQHQSFPIDK